MKELTVEITNESGLHARPATAYMMDVLIRFDFYLLFRGIFAI